MNRSTSRPAREQTQTGSSDGPPSARAGAAVSAFMAAVLWILSLKLPAETVVDAGAAAWFVLAGMILRDALQLGSVLALGIGVSILTFHKVMVWERQLLTWSRRKFLLATCALTGALTVFLSYFVLDHMGHIPDEFAMLFQAENFARGQLYAKAPPAELAPFFDLEFVVIDGDKWYGRYFPAASLLFVPGIWLGVPWLVNPILGVLSLPLFYALGRDLLGEKTGRLVVLLAVISPLYMTTFSLEMSHAGCLFFGTLFILYVLKAARDPRRYRYWLISASALGMTLHYRPLTMLCLAIPTFILAAWTCRWWQVTAGSVPAFLLPIGVFVALFLGYNKVLTGDALVMPFEQWSPTEHLGFGADVGLDYWKHHHGYTLADALDNTRINLDALGVSLLGWGRGVLLLMVMCLLSRWRRMGHLLAGGVVFALVGAHFFYYHHGEIASIPRYWSEGLAFMILLALGGLTFLRVLIGKSLRLFGLRYCGARARVALWVSAAILTTIGSVRVAPAQINLLRFGHVFIGPELRDVIGRESPRNALVFVPTGWYRDLELEPDRFGVTVALNSPNLDGEVVFARDLGDEQNKILMRHYPQRQVFRFEDEHLGSPALVPLPRPE